MFNILLDKLPEEWEGYEIDTDFRIGIQLSLALEDKSLNQKELMYVIVNLLFKDEHPQDINKCTECLQWYLNGWNTDKVKSTNGKSNPIIDFDVDQGRIYSAFLSQYRLDLSLIDMHWWKFMYLLTNLEECAFNRVVGIRNKVIDAKMSKEEKKQYMEAKKIFSLAKNETEELSEEEKLKEQEALAIFQGLLTQKKD